MKKRISMAVSLLSSLLFIGSLSYGQKLSVSDLLKLSKTDDDEFDTYVTKKGYKLSSKERPASFKEAMVTTYVYSSDDNTLSGEYIIRKVVTDIGLVQMEFQTLQRTVYLELKNQLKSSGYIYINSETIAGGAISLHYKKGDDDFELISGPCTNGLSEQTTAYSITYLFVAK